MADTVFLLYRHDSIEDSCSWDTMLGIVDDEEKAITAQIEWETYVETLSEYERPQIHLTRIVLNEYTPPGED